MRCGRVLDFTGACATAAYVLARQHRLALAGAAICSMAQEQGAFDFAEVVAAIILSTARASRATFWTQDVDYDGSSGVRYFAKPSA